MQSSFLLHGPLPFLNDYCPLIDPYIDREEGSNMLQVNQPVSCSLGSGRFPKISDKERLIATQMCIRRFIQRKTTKSEKNKLNLYTYTSTNKSLNAMFEQRRFSLELQIVHARFIAFKQAKLKISCMTNVLNYNNKWFYFTPRTVIYIHQLDRFDSLPNNQNHLISRWHAQWGRLRTSYLEFIKMY